MELIKGLLLVAAMTPICWVGVLMVVRRIRQTGLVGPGLAELFDQAEKYAWGAGVFLALLLVNLLAGPGGALLKGLVLVAVLTPVCWGGVMVGLRQVRRMGLLGPGLDGSSSRAEGWAWVIGAVLAVVLVGLLAMLGVPFLRPGVTGDGASSTIST